MTLNNFVSSCQLWLRLTMFILGPLRDGLLNVLHNNGVPKKPKDLHSYLVSKKTTLARLKGKGVITQPQWNLLFPPGKIETDYKLFDITLIVLLIEALELIASSGKNRRNTNPPVTDTSVRAFCIRARNMRNYLNHFADITALNGSEFSLKWSELLKILHGLNYNHPFDVNELKTVSLDLQNNSLLQALILGNQIRLDQHDNEINKLRNENASFEYHTTLNFTTLNEELESLRCELLSNSNEAQNIQLKIEETHTEITHGIECLNAKVEGLSNRMENLEGQNLPSRMEALEGQKLPKRMKIMEEGVYKLMEMQEHHEGLSNRTEVVEENVGKIKDEQRGLSNRTEVVEKNVGKIKDEQRVLKEDIY